MHRLIVSRIVRKGWEGPVIDSVPVDSQVSPSATHISHSRTTTAEIDLGNMPVPRGASCNRIPAALGARAEEISSSFRIQLGRVPSCRSPGTTGQVAEVSDETPRSRKRFKRAGTFSLRTRETTSSVVTCGCRKSDDHPAGSCPGSRGQIRARREVKCNDSTNVH